MSGSMVSEATQNSSVIQEIKSEVEHLVLVLSLFGFEPNLVRETIRHLRDALNKLDKRSNR